MLDQLRRGFKNKISANPFILSGTIPQKTNDGIGGFKIIGTLPQSYVNPVRISKGFIEQGKYLNKGEPKVDDERWIIEADFETTLDVGLEFDYFGYRFKTLAPIMDYIKFGGIYGHGANLQIISEYREII